MSTALTKSFERNLNNKKSERSIALPTNGKRIACSLDMVSYIIPKQNKTNKVEIASSLTTVSKHKFACSYSWRRILHRTKATHVNRETCRKNNIQVRVHPHNKRCHCQTWNQNNKSFNFYAMHQQFENNQSHPPILNPREM